MAGSLLVRGGMHIVAYAKALEKLTGVDVGKLLPIPDANPSGISSRNSSFEPSSPGIDPDMRAFFAKKMGAGPVAAKKHA